MRAGERAYDGATISLPGCHGRPSLLAWCEAMEGGREKKEKSRGGDRRGPPTIAIHLRHHWSTTREMQEGDKEMLQ